MFLRLFRLLFRKPRVVSVEVEPPAISRPRMPRKQFTTESKQNDSVVERLFSMSDISEEAKKRVLEELKGNSGRETDEG